MTAGNSTAVPAAACHYLCLSNPAHRHINMYSVECRYAASSGRKMDVAHCRWRWHALPVARSLCVAEKAVVVSFDSCALCVVIYITVIVYVLYYDSQFTSD